MQHVKEFSKLMQGEFEMSLIRELNYFLGIQINQLNEGTFICQTKYYNDLPKRFGMEGAKSIDTAMPTNGNLERNENGKDVDVKKYRGMIGYLLYLTAYRPDIMFSFCMCVRYQSTPKESHLKVVKHILRYLYGTSKYGLCYSKGSDCNFVGYTDSDFSSCKSDRKSTTRTCHIFSNSLVSWHSKKHVFVALSIAKAEYVASSSCCA
ncbi:secreted RxLR effector protein 161-like [Lathyrus oleraceus]|uniref:secreted RxLR effector protein 161-like n=1 Tax=Pisum sativum TaxID=3888 RepID=UPI0021D288CE|nr:secreted RxLR effector protein 161-like [Pisum sativum]